MSQNVWIVGLFCVACAGAAAQQHHDSASGATAGRATMKNPAGTSPRRRLGASRSTSASRRSTFLNRATGSSTWESSTSLVTRTS